MRSAFRSLLRLAGILLVLSLMSVLTACATTDTSVAIAEQGVTPISVGERGAVGAYDLAKAMLRAGFTSDQILNDGPQVQAALATAGGAQVRHRNVTVALFALHDHSLYVTSNAMGTFIQPLSKS